MKRDDGYCPYEKWSRKAYRDAYEEADKLLQERVAECKELREKAKDVEMWKASNLQWMQHALLLGKAIERLLKD